MKKVAWLTGALAAAAALSGCDSFDAGDYVVYRIASHQPKLSSSCYWPKNVPDPQVASDSNTMMSAGTIVLFKGGDETFYLDIGSAMLEGGEVEADEGTGYEFDGKVVDVTFDGDNGTGTKRVTTVDTKVGMTVDGAALEGEATVKKSWACTGTGCGQIPPACKATIAFVGTEVEDVALEHTVAASGIGMPEPPTQQEQPISGSGGGSGGGSGSGSGSGGAGGGSGGDNCTAAGAKLESCGLPNSLEGASCSGQAACLSNCVMNASCEDIKMPSSDSPYYACVQTCSG
jgi:uncharacterized membrane protein YgcG